MISPALVLAGSSNIGCHVEELAYGEGNVEGLNGGGDDYWVGARTDGSEGQLFFVSSRLCIGMPS